MMPGYFTAMLETVQRRFEENRGRHEGIEWADVRKRLDATPLKLQSLYQMERSGGEPDVIGVDEASGAYLICDCSAESPTGRRSLCYDKKAWEKRKKNKPENNVIDAASFMNIELLTETQYRGLQELGEFDLKTSSWIQTPTDIREKGGALFCERRYGKVFVFHNGAQSYYAARGFRGLLRL